MPQYCCVPQCWNRIGGHAFPREETHPELRLLWRRAIRRFDLDTNDLYMPNKNAVVCADHFLETDFVKGDFTLGLRRRLKPDAIPSVFPFNSIREGGTASNGRGKSGKVTLVKGGRPKKGGSPRKTKKYLLPDYPTAKVLLEAQKLAKASAPVSKDKVLKLELLNRDDDGDNSGTSVQTKDLKLLNEAVSLTNVFKDLSHMIHFGYDVNDTYLHVTRKNWYGAFFPGCSPVKVVLRADGSTHFVVEFGDSQTFNCCQPNGTLDRDQFQLLLEKLSVHGNHFYCPGLSQTEADIVSDCSRLVHDRHPYKRWAADNCDLYSTRTVGVSQNERKSGFYRCRNCRLLLANEVKKGVAEVESEDDNEKANIAVMTVIAAQPESKPKPTAAPPKKTAQEARSPLARISTQSVNISKRTLERPSRKAKKAATTRMRVLQRIVTADSDEEIDEDEMFIGKGGDEEELGVNSGESILSEPASSPQTVVPCGEVLQVIKMERSDTLAMTEILDD